MALGVFIENIELNVVTGFIGGFLTYFMGTLLAVEGVIGLVFGEFYIMRSDVSDLMLGDKIGAAWIATFAPQDNQHTLVVRRGLKARLDGLAFFFTFL